MSRVLAVGVVAAVAVAACGSDGDDEAAPGSTTSSSASPAMEPSSERWLEVDVETGEIRAPGFNDMIDDERPARANTASGAAELLVAMGDEGETDVRVEADSTVVVTFSGLQDDSVEAVRYRLGLRRGEDDLFRFVDGSWSQMCQPGRGHDDRFLAEPCI